MKSEKKNWRAKTFFNVVNNLGGIGKTMDTIVDEYDNMATPFRGESNRSESRNYVRIGLHLLTEFGLLTKKGDKYIYLVHKVVPSTAPPPPVGVRLGDQPKPWYFPAGSHICVDYDHEREVLYFFPDPMY